MYLILPVSVIGGPLLTSQRSASGDQVTFADGLLVAATRPLNPLREESLTDASERVALARARVIARGVAVSSCKKAVGPPVF